MDVLVVRRHISIGRRTLSYLTAGSTRSDRLVVFLHAFPLSAAMWKPQLQALPAGWAAVAPDFRGFGESAPDDADLLRADASLQDYADDVGALLDALGSTRAALCGCSMGGYVAFAALRRAPARVGGLLLADTRTGADDGAARASRQAMLDLLDRGGPAAVAAEMRTRLVGPTSQAGRPDVLAAIDRMMAGATPSGIGHAVSRILGRPDSAAELAAFRGPVTIVVGEEDSLTPPSEAASMAAAAPGAALVTIPGAGHLSSLEVPEAFNAALGRWLATMSVAAE